MRQRQAHRAKWIEENGPCRECGSWDNLRAHHPEGKTLPFIWLKSKAKRKAELATYVVSCSKCLNHQHKPWLKLPRVKARQERRRNEWADMP